MFVAACSSSATANDDDPSLNRDAGGWVDGQPAWVQASEYNDAGVPVFDASAEANSDAAIDSATVMTAVHH